MKIFGIYCSKAVNHALIYFVITTAILCSGLISSSFALDLSDNGNNEMINSIYQIVEASTTSDIKMVDLNESKYIKVNNRFNEQLLDTVSLDTNKYIYGPTETAVISEEYANELLEDIMVKDQVSYLYKESGCNERAHIISKNLNEKGIITSKVFYNKEVSHSYPYASQMNYSGMKYGTAKWNYHVANLIVILQDGIKYPAVIDPSISSKIISIKDWIQEINNKNNLKELDNNIVITPRFAFTPNDFKKIPVGFLTSKIELSIEGDSSVKKTHLARKKHISYLKKSSIEQKESADEILRNIKLNNLDRVSLLLKSFDSNSIISSKAEDYSSYSCELPVLYALKNKSLNMIELLFANNINTKDCLSKAVYEYKMNRSDKELFKSIINTILENNTQINLKEAIYSSLSSEVSSEVLELISQHSSFKEELDQKNKLSTYNGKVFNTLFRYGKPNRESCSKAKILLNNIDEQEMNSNELYGKSKKDLNKLCKKFWKKRSFFSRLFGN